MQMIKDIGPVESRAAVDLRSDTVTRPTAAMYLQMRAAPLGDDGLDGDPTVQRLEMLAATALGKEAGLFVPSCTMANLLATLAQAQRNEQVVVESTAHIYTSERGSTTFTGVFYIPVPGISGAMNLEILEDSLSSDRSRMRVALVCVETSHNNASGAVLPLQHMEHVYEMAHGRGLNVHLDGARMFNAAVALNVPPVRIACYADTVSLCLSKGLSAPGGAILAGTNKTIEKARLLRKMLGGTQRQVGIMAAAGIEAIQVMGARLSDDHARARRLSDALNSMHPRLSATKPQTNIIQVDVSQTGKSSAEWSAELADAGLKARPWGRKHLRCVTHRHIDDDAIDLAIAAFQNVSSKLA